MTVARENIAPPPGVSLSPLAARLELLLRRAITMEQFEADMVSCCGAHPDEIWNLLALLDQYHRLDRLPTELYRELRAAADRYGLVRREPYIPPATAATQPGAEQLAAHPAAARDAPTPEHETPVSVERPAAVAAPAPAPPPAIAPTPAPRSAFVPDAETNATPFRHLLTDAPASAGDLRIDSAPLTTTPATSTWQGSRYTPPTPPRRRRSRARTLLLPALLLAVALGAAAWLKQGQGSVDMLAGPEDAAQRATNTAAVPTPTPAATATESMAPQMAAPVPAPSVELEPPVPAGPPPSPVAAATAPAQPPSPPPALATPQASAPAPQPTPSSAQAAPPAATSAATPAAAAAPAAAVAPKPAPAVAAAGPAAVEFASGSYTVRPGDSAARIVVRRSGNPDGELGFTWWTENGSAVADVDYVAWGKRAEKIPAGRSSVTLLVPIINDSTRTAPRQFQVVIGRAGNGAPLGATTHATVQLTN